MGPGWGIGRPIRNLAANTGISVRLMTIDTRTAMHSAQLNEEKNCPYTPAMNASGKKTSTVVSVEPTTAPVISPDAASTGSGGPEPEFKEAPPGGPDSDAGVLSTEY